MPAQLPDGQEEHQNNGPAERQQDQTTAQVSAERQAQGAESLEERRSSNRNLLRRFLQEVDEDTQAAPSLRDRERHRRISRNTVPSLRDAMRQSIGGPGIMGDQVEEDESGVGGLIPYELLPDDKQTGNHGVIVIDGRELTAHQTSRLASQCGSVRMCNKETCRWRSHPRV